MFHFFFFQFCCLWIQEHQVVDRVITQVAVDDPVHQLEASECDWKEDPAVLVDVGGRHPEEFVEVLAFALRV